MFGTLLVFVGTFFGEVSSSIGKYAIRHRIEGLFTLSFADNIWSVVFFFVIALAFPGERVLISASVIALAPLALLNVFQSYVTTRALVAASRSTFGFVRTGTIPLVLAADLALGYGISSTRIVGICIVTLALLFLYTNHGLDRRGLGWAAVSAVNGAIGISLYKWLLTQGNGVAVVQLIQVFCIWAVSLALALSKRERPWQTLRKPLILAQSSLVGLDAVLESYAYVFLPASVIVALSRSLAVGWCLIFGRLAFHEKHLWIKAVGGVGIVVGIICLAL